MDDIRVEIERMGGKLDLLDQRIDSTLDVLTQAVQELTREMKNTVRLLVFAVIASSVSAEALRIIAAAILKGMP